MLIERGDLLSDNTTLNQEQIVALFSMNSGLKVLKSESAKKINQDYVRRLMADPVKNSKKLQDISLYLYYVSGQYRRTIDYLSGLLTFDYFPYPIKSTKLAKNSFVRTNDILQKLNIKYNMGWMTFYLMLFGELFIYEIGDLFMIIPNSICRIVEVSNGVNKFAVDLNKVSKTDLEILPDDIVRAYEKKSSYDVGFGKGIYYVENGFALNLIYNKSIGVPPFCTTFDDILNLDEVKDISSDSQKAEALKLIHQKVPLDDKNKPSIGRDLQQTYHNDVKKAVPKNVGVATSPMEINMLSFVDSQSRDKYYINLAKENVFDSSGVSSMLFNNTGTSGEALKKSIMVDELFLYKLLPCYENIINEKIRKTNFAIQFLRTTYNNKWEQMKSYKDSLSVGGSSLVYLAYTGLEPFQSMNLLEFERDVLDIDSLVTPKKTSHTMGSDDSDVGREKSENPSDITEKTREND